MGERNRISLVDFEETYSWQILVLDYKVLAILAFVCFVIAVGT